MERIRRVKKKLDSELLSLKGVNGSAVKQKGGKYYLVVYVDKLNGELRRNIPRRMEGTEVCVEEIGETGLL